MANSNGKSPEEVFGLGAKVEKVRFHREGFVELVARTPMAINTHTVVMPIPQLKTIMAAILQVEATAGGVELEEEAGRK